MEAARTSVLPATIPFWEIVEVDGRMVGSCRSRMTPRTSPTRRVEAVPG